MLKTAAAVALALAVATPALSEEDRTGWPESFTVGTASQGGTYFVYGSGWANMVSEMLGVPGGAEVTGGPVQNASLVQTGDMEMAMVTMGPAADAIAGESPLVPGLAHDQIRALFPMYKTAFHVVVPADAPYETVGDITPGSTVGVGPQGGTPGTYWPRIFTTLGLEIEPQFGGAADLAGQLQDGLVDAFAFASGLPTPAFSQLDAQMDVKFLGFSPEDQAKIVEAQPVAEFVIPGDTYPSMDGEQASVSMWNFAIGNADLPESFVYAVVDAVMSNNPQMLQIHKAAVETLPENFDKNTIIPWHPGAVRWFEENGFTIPDELKG